MPISPRLALRHGRDLCPFKAVYLTYTYTHREMLTQADYWQMPFINALVLAPLQNSDGA